MQWERLGKNQKKILVLMLSGLALGYTKDLKRSVGIIKAAGSYLKNFEEIEKNSRNYAIKKLYKSKLIETKKNKDGFVTLVLSENGRKKALTYKIENMTLNKPKSWDKLWRIVIFDVPERKKYIREVLRHTLRQMDFYKLQKSVFVTPCKCKNELEYLIEYYDIRKYVRVIVAKSIDNELEIMEYYNL